MQSTYEARTGEQIEIKRRLRQGTEEIVSTKFGAVAKAIWPHKTALELAAIANTDERAAWRWISGEHEPPGCILAAVLLAITKPRKRR